MSANPSTGFSALPRRAVLAGGLAALAMPRLALGAASGLPAGIPASGRLGFDISYRGNHLGTHVLTFHRNGADFSVDVAVDLLFKLGPLTLFRYSHHATERWSGSEVAGVETQTNDNGKRFRVTGRREGGGLVVESNSQPRYVAPPSALPATHWNRRELDGPWINTQDGKLIRPNVASRGDETIPTAGSSRIRARRYALSGPVQLDMWYDDDQQWAGLAFTKGGSEVRYLRQV